MPRRLIAILAILLVALPIAGAAPAAAASPTAAELDAAEARVEQLINRRRDSRDKRPFRHDSRVARLARASESPALTWPALARHHARRPQMRPRT